jgi:transposase
VTKPYSEAFKRRMVQRLMGKDAISMNQLSRETGVPAQNLSRWLAQARTLPRMPSDRPTQKTWTFLEKARVLTETANLEGDALTAYLQREGLRLAEVDRWRLALEDRETASMAMAKRVRSLERELVRKDKALAEAAALLVLKKKVELLYQEAEDDDTNQENDK